jgi:hypothetical protein
MSQFDAAPPNTHAGGNDDALRTKGHDPMNAPAVYTDERVNMEEYARTVPLWKRFWQHSLTQMMLLSVQAFCGPAMADAIAGELASHTAFITGSILICSRSWWRRSRYPPDVKHRNRDQLHYARLLLSDRWTHC